MAGRQHKVIHHKPFFIDLIDVKKEYSLSFSDFFSMLNIVKLCLPPRMVAGAIQGYHCGEYVVLILPFFGIYSVSFWRYGAGKKLEIGEWLLTITQGKKNMAEFALDCRIHLFMCLASSEFWVILVKNK